MAMMGVLAVPGSPRSVRVASMPETLGSCTSIRIRSGCSFRAMAMPLSPSGASRSL